MADETEMKKLKQLQLDKIQAYKEVFGTEKGQEVLHDLVFKFCMVGDEAPIGADIGTIMFREGKRAVGLALLKVLERDETQLINAIRNGNKKTQRALADINDLRLGDE